MNDNFEIGDINYGPDKNQPVAVVDVIIGGVLYHVPCLDYDEAIQEGRTEFVIKGDHVSMVTPERLEDIKKALKWIKEQKKQ